MDNLGWTRRTLGYEGLDLWGSPEGCVGGADYGLGLESMVRYWGILRRELGRSVLGAL